MKRSSKAHTVATAIPFFEATKPPHRKPLCEHSASSKSETILALFAKVLRID